MALISKAIVVLYGGIIISILLGLVEVPAPHASEFINAMRSVFFFHVMAHVVIAIRGSIPRCGLIAAFLILFILLLVSLLLSVHDFNFESACRDIKSGFDFGECFFWFLIAILLYSMLSVVLVYSVAPFFILTFFILKASSLWAKNTLLSVQVGLFFLFVYLHYFHTEAMHGGWFFCFPIICLYPAVLIAIGISRGIPYLINRYSF